MKFFPSPPLKYPYHEEPLGEQMTPEEYERSRKLLARVAPVLLVLFGLLLLRLWFLQLIKGDYLQMRSEYNRIRSQDIPPWRGMIMDRAGNILVDNRHSFNLMASLEDIQDPDTLGRRLGSLLKIDGAALVAQIDKARRAGLSQVRLKSQLTWDEMALVETYKAELPGVFIMIASRREYHQPMLASHELGYLGEITEAQLKSGRFPSYKMGDYLGRSGIEAAWEDMLRGKQGSRRIEVDAFGRELGQLDQTPAIPGANITLTLDSRLQEKAEELLEGKVGSIVALNPNNGKILAMASSPTFSQATFERGVNPEDWKRLVEDKDHPLINRAIRGQYPPGSTFKIVMAVAGLEEGVITPKTVINCKGVIEVGKHEFHCWKRSGHGDENLHQALMHSCDVYFYEVGRRLGIERIDKWCKRFGLGVPTGIKLAGELPGLIGSPEWKRRRYHSGWQEGDTLSLSIGQGYNLATPLQVARMIATLANGGTLYQPQLVEKVEAPSGEILYNFQPVVQGHLDADPANLELVRKGLLAVVRNGTGRRAYLDNVEVAGKTGTSQVVSLEKEKTGRNVQRFQNHAWFAAYAPADDPQVAVSVLIEHGGQGGEVAAPLARKFLASYFAHTQVARNRE
jgi:penicillin-binding protein 2|uniref:Penicillin-binding protein 2 n=1 Tax=Desulfobacca acetoxidans TaxID=60893 RepID=A0A7V6DNS2_9BACT